MEILSSYKIINDDIELNFNCPVCNKQTAIIIPLKAHNKYNSGALIQ
jgi:transcription elongation factor Elf1